MDPVEFSMPRPGTKSTSRRLVTIGGKRRIIKSAKGVASSSLAKQIAYEATEHHDIIGDDDVRVEMDYDVASETCTFRVTPMRPRPKGRTGRRCDLANLPEVVLDAMQGIVFANDNQVAELVLRRIPIPEDAPPE